MRINLTKIVMLMSLIFMLIAFFWGESQNYFGASFVALIVGFVAVGVTVFLLNTLIKQSIIGIFLISLVLLVSWIVAFALGARFYTDAFNECVNHGEIVRQALVSYQQTHQSYPSSLSQLPLNLPGKRIFHPNLLQYKATDKGYSLFFGDAMVTFSASESHPFEAHQ